MDENPYKAPQERGTPGASFPWQRVGNVVAIVMIGLFLALILAILLSVVGGRMLPPSIWLD
jgi:predicted membrane protein